MQHEVILREEGRYNAFPILDRLPDGRLSLACVSSPFGDHHGMADWPVFVSSDQGRTWAPSADPALPPNWPGSTPREKYDRLCRILPDGGFLSVGSVGHEAWDPDRRAEAEARGLRVYEEDIIERQYPGRMVVSGHRLVVQRSSDSGATWERRTWTVPGYQVVLGFPRGTVLDDGTWLFPVYTTIASGGCDGLMFRSADGGDTWGLHLAVPRICSEWAVVEVSPGVVLGHIRSAHRWGHPQDDRMYALEVWSDDGGRTWTQPVEAAFQGYPNHLLRLRDGRIVCSFGYRRQPMGVSALLSEDGGRTWDLEHEYVLRDDAGTASNAWPEEKRAQPGFGSSDVGYPVSIELSDGWILTAYYTTPSDGTTHVATTRWHPDADRQDSDPLLT